jgi:hypothetical protein
VEKLIKSNADKNDLIQKQGQQMINIKKYYKTVLLQIQTMIHKTVETWGKEKREFQEIIETSTKTIEQQNEHIEDLELKLRKKSEETSTKTHWLLPVVVTGLSIGGTLITMFLNPPKKTIAALPPVRKNFPNQQKQPTSPNPFTNQMTNIQSKGPIISTSITPSAPKKEREYPPSIPVKNANPSIDSSCFTMPITYFLPRIPPVDPSTSLLFQQLKKTKGRQFEKYIKWFLEFLCFRVELTKETGDKGADLIVNWLGKKIVIQLKQKENVGTEAIQEVLGALKYYNADQAWVITTGKYTKPAIEYAQKTGVVYWDGKQLVEELYKHNFFYPPEYI